MHPDDCGAHPKCSGSWSGGNRDLEPMREFRDLLRSSQRDLRKYMKEIAASPGLTQAHDAVLGVLARLMMEIDQQWTETDYEPLPGAKAKPF